MDEVTLTIATISDLYGNVSTNQSYSFTGGDVNVPPTVTIENIPSEVSGDVYIEYTITDPENNTVSLSVHYSTDGGTTWNDVSILGNITDLSSDKFTGAFFWESRLDFPSVRVENVILRITPARQERRHAVSVKCIHHRQQPASFGQFEYNPIPTVCILIRSPYHTPLPMRKTIFYRCMHHTRWMPAKHTKPQR